MVATRGIADAKIEQLEERVRGQILRPGQPGYDDARTIWNAMIDRRPALIVRCAGASDVIAAVQFAREHELRISVRGGGHNVAGSSLIDDGLMIDLSQMKSIRVDPAGRTARVEPGVRWGELDAEAQAFGLATVGGTVKTTGIAGLTLGGGFGWLTGKHGMTIDNLLSADVVTADGQLVHASETEHPDLFWALRGAGANFGIVTSFEYRLHPVGPLILGGMVIYPIEQLREMLRFYRDFAPSAPDELTVYAAAVTTPDGMPAAALALCYCGDLEAGNRVIEPVRAFGQPIVDALGPMPYMAQQELLSRVFPDGRQNYWKAGLTATLTDEAIETIAEYAPRVPSPLTAIVIACSGGAAARVAPDAMAYFHRSAIYNLMILSHWEDPADNDRNVSWTREFFEAVQPHLSGGVYVNDLNDPRDEGDARVRAAYGGNYARLAALKAQYDPTNFFRQNQNIPPAPSRR
ncbi:MAG TPA: FAD-binding oxidoreductase [Thermomicrobiales bacterium]|nr:FAD-binding oxidoreductase [Thermomicrobiales bacterium]